MLWKNLEKVSRVKVWGFLALCVMGCALFAGCGGPSLPGKIELLDTYSEEEATAILKNDKYLYVATQAGKLLVYDISNPSAPKSLGQTDSFPGPHVGMAVASGGETLILLGKNNKIGLFNIGDNPAKPSGIWGRGKTFQLPGKSGPFIVNEGASAMYMTPGGGTALVRIDISAFLLQSLDKLKANEVTKTFTGGGGGGIKLVTDNNGSPVRLYIGNKDSGKLDIWMVSAIEGGTDKPGPVASSDLKVGKDVSAIYTFRDATTKVDEWLLIKGVNEVEIMALGRRWKDAADPKSEGTIAIDGMMSIEPTSFYLVSNTLTVYDFSKRGNKPPSEYLKEPVKMAAIELRTEIEIRGMVTVGDVVFTAEAKGFRAYKITRGKTSE